MSHRHLSDDQLLETAVSSDADGRYARHLATCPECQVRHQTLDALVADVTAVGRDEVDRAFSPQRLERQRARILQRIEQDGRPGRVITFPAAMHGRQPLLRAHRSMRWVAAAAVIAFVGGLATDHVAHGVLGQRAIRQTAQHTPAPRPTDVPRLASAGWISDEDLLGQVEAAVDRVGPASLSPLDSLTPRVNSR